MRGQDILKAMNAGSTLYSSGFGFWLISPIDARCTNVHNGAAKSLARRKIIIKKSTEQWVINPSGARLQRATSTLNL
jgi:hypothetical protein